ncbi:MAG: hypothetical protein AAFV53_25935 [Myxococcota bacterium]
MRHPLNPHSGSIPLPDDPRLLRAARCAAEISWRTVPYYNLRYGKRGWQFSLSDSAWMTTLPPCGRQQTLRQLRWLWRTLSNRGMPGWLLEQHLVVLRHQLMKHAPQQGADWELLDAARRDLIEERSEILTEDEFDERARSFACIIGAPDHRLVLGSGYILTSAAVDAVLGANRAIFAVLEWFTDRQRFPPHWQHAARRCIDLDTPMLTVVHGAEDYG